MFWTRARSEGAAEDDVASMSEEERQAFIQEKRNNQTEEENRIMEDLGASLSYTLYFHRDMPEGTVVTAPYYTDLNVLVTLK